MFCTHLMLPHFAGNSLFEEECSRGLICTKAAFLKLFKSAALHCDWQQPGFPWQGQVKTTGWMDAGVTIRSLLLPSPRGNAHIPSSLQTPAVSNYSCLCLPHPRADDLQLASTPFSTIFYPFLSTFCGAGLNNFILRGQSSSHILFVMQCVQHWESEQGKGVFAEARLNLSAVQFLPIYSISNMYKTYIAEKWFILLWAACPPCVYTLKKG